MSYGWGWPKGKGKGWGYWQRPAKPQNSVPDDFSLDESIRYSGTVTAYYKFQGYGFITLDQKGVVPGDKVFVYWKNIDSRDRYPTLEKDLKVELALAKVQKQGVTTINAAAVSAPEGAPITLQAVSDSKKTFVGGQNLRYTGSLKFFIPKRGYGYIAIDDGFQLDPDVPKEIRVETSEVDAGGKQPGYAKDLQVEFGIWKTPKGAYKAFHVTMPGGVPLPAEEPPPV